MIRRGARALTLAPSEDSVYTFDLEGRPVSWWEEGTVYKRSLASEVHERRTEPGGRVRRKLPEVEGAERLARVLERGGAIPEVARWSVERLLAERERFAAVYRPISILPPDQYLSVVVQATFGCTWNRCVFCSFYQDRPFATRSDAELVEHVEGVAAFLGKGAALRRSIFLADGNALVLANAKLRPTFAIARRVFPGRPIHGFVDVMTGERKPVAAWEELRSWGLARVHVGVETGHDALLGYLNKPGSAEETAAFVATLKEARLSVAAIFLVGAGGERFAEGHVADTVALARRLPLDASDLVYLSPFVPTGGIDVLDPAGIERQLLRLREAIRGTHPSVRIARYDLREFLY